MEWGRGGVSSLCTCLYSCPSTICEETLLLPMIWSCTPVRKLTGCDVWVYFWILSSIPLFYLRIFIPTLTLFLITIALVHFKLGSVSPPICFLLLDWLFWLFWVLEIMYEFENWLFHFWQESWCLRKKSDCTESVVSFGEFYHLLTILDFAT